MATRRTVACCGLAAAMVLAALGLVGLSTPASAATPGDIPLTPATQTVQYGQGWYVEGGGIEPFGCNAPDPCDYELYATVDGVTKVIPPSHVTEDFSVYVGDTDFYPDKDFGVGSFTVSLVEKNSVGTVMYQSATPAQVTVTAAPVVSTTTIAADPNNTANAIITSQLSGDYIDQLPNCDCEGAGFYDLPAGNWNLTVKDSNGKTVFHQEAAQKSAGDPYFVNYWQNVPSGEDFTAQTTYTVDGSHASDFVPTQPSFSWTSASTVGGGGATTPTNKPEAKSVKAGAFALPLEVYVAALAVTVILIALDVVFLVRRRRKRPTSPVAPSNAAGVEA